MFGITFTMDDETRRKAFRAYFERRWVKDDARAAQAQAAKDMELSEGRISQVLNGVGAFGERAARNFAAKCGLPDDAFLGASRLPTIGPRQDVSHIEALDRILQVARGLDPDDQAILGAMLQALAKSPESAAKREALLDQLTRWESPIATLESRRASGGA